MIRSNSPGPGDDDNSNDTPLLRGEQVGRRKAVVRQKFVEPLSAPRVRKAAGGPAVLITGGAGFLGTNLAHRLLQQRRRVIVLDNLARPGAERNLQWLRQQHDGRLRFETGDVRDDRFMRELAGQAAEIYHLAGFGGELKAMNDPLRDFDVNVRGTLSVLEAVRGAARKPRLVMASTARVYGKLDTLKLRDGKERVEAADRTAPIRIDESQPLSFCTPHACSRGAADQYVIDYARTYELPATVLRMSTVYGPHQSGSLDQHWVANLMCRAIEGKPLSVTGDGKQVRDLLHADDAVDALIAAMEHADEARGSAYNLGGGLDRARSVLQVIDAISEITGSDPTVEHTAERPGDARYFVADTRALEKLTGWSPRISVADGLAMMYEAITAARGGRAATTEPQPA